MVVRRRPLVTAGVIVVVAVLVGACESSGVGAPGGRRAATRAALAELQAAAASAPTSTVNTTTMPFAVTMDAAQRLIFFKRAVGGDPTASQVTIDRDGHAAALVTDGGIEGEKKHYFTLSPSQLAQLRRTIARTRLHDTSCCDVRYWIYWVSLRGRTYRLADKQVPASARPLMDTLDALIDAHTQY
jgi:hypothetical protein